MSTNVAVLSGFAAWDVRHAKLVGHCAPTSGIAPFNQLVHKVMDHEPYRSAPRVFWVVDNGSSHRGRASVERLQRQWPNIEVVHLPIHASGLNQIEIYFSIVQRKVLTPNDFPDLQTLEAQLFKFQDRYQRMAQPFEWRFTRADLARLSHGSMPATLCSSARDNTSPNFRATALRRFAASPERPFRVGPEASYCSVRPLNQSFSSS